MSVFAEHCQNYFKKGYPVIPICAGTKRPLPNEWNRWGAEPLEEKMLLEWKGKYRDAGIGVCLGPQARIIAFDYDLDENIPLHKELHGKIKHLLPLSPVSKCGKKGSTHFFRYNGEQSVTIKKKIGDQSQLLNVCEVLSVGRQTVLPPTIHPETGKPYFWSQDAGLLECDAETLPFLCWASIEEIKRIVDQWVPTTELADTTDSAKSSGRNDQLKSMAAAAIHARKSDESIATELIDYDKKFHQPPLFSDPAEPQYRGRSVHENALGFVRRIRKSIGVEATRDAPQEPIPLMPELGPETPYPVDALGPILGGAARAMHDAIQAPLALCGQSVLAAATLAVQPHANVCVDGRPYPLSNNFISIAESGERKTTLDSLALRQHYEIERLRRQQYRDELKVFKAKKALYEKELSTKLAKVKSQEEIDRIYQEIEEPNEPVNPRFLTEEPTAEGILKLLNEGTRTLGVFSSEGGQLFSNHSFKEENFVKTAAFFSRTWDGNRVDNTRATTDSIIVDNPRVSIHVMLQPIIAERIIKDPLLKGQGFLARALICFPASTIGDRPYRNIDLTQSESMLRYWAVIQEILSRPLPFDDLKKRNLLPRTLKLSEGAYQQYVSFYNHVEERLKKGAALIDVKEFGCKAAEHVLRLAGMMTVVDCFDAEEISSTFVERAIAIADYNIEERLRLIGLAADPNLLLAQRVLDWCRFQKIEIIHSQRIIQYGPRPLREKKKAECVWKILEEYGWFRRLPPSALVDGKPRKMAWEVVYV